MGLVGIGSARKSRCARRDLIWPIVFSIGSLSIVLSTSGAALGQNQNGAQPTSGVKGKIVFEMRCATCHGLDGLGGEHAPDVAHQPAVKDLSDQALFNLIHDGIPQRGMPAFIDLGREDGDAVVAYLRFLQGKFSGSSVPGNPDRGRELFFGKAGCSDCHRSSGRGQTIAADLADFSQVHELEEIRDAILRPSGRSQETATVVSRDGRKFSGMIRNEDNSSLQLQDTDGRFYLLMKSSVASVQRHAGTPMPADYIRRLSPAELDDLIAYIVRESRDSAPLSQSGKDMEPHAQD